MKEQSGIVFYGTPVFALESLKAVASEGYHIAAVVTAPDKPAGRGMKMTASPVKQFALERGLRLLQPEKLSSDDFISALRSIHPAVQVVVAFRMMPRSVWSLPEMGTFNLHASLLPQYRGAAPINWAVINGEKETGLTTFFLSDRIDTGDILYREKLEIGDEETAGELHDRMMVQGARLVIRTLEGIFNGSAKAVAQENLSGPAQILKPAPKIFRETCRISWNMPAARIFNLIRGLSPVPAAFTGIRLKDGSTDTLKILKASVISSPVAEIPGTLVSDGRNYLRFAASDGYIDILELQLAGRKAVKTCEFLRGSGRNIV